MTRRVVRSRWRHLVFAAYLAGAFVVLGEVVVRVWGYADRYLYDPIYETFDADIPYVHKPNLRGARAWGKTVIDTDALGLRSVQAAASHGPKPAGEYRVAVLGDSVTFGEGVATEDTFCRRLEERLNAAQSRVRVRVFNFGVSGYSVRQMAVTLERRALALEPDFVAAVLIPADFDVGRAGTVDAWGYLQPSGEPPHRALLRRSVRHLHLFYFVRDVYQRQTSEWSSAPLDGLPVSYRYVTRIRDVCEAHDLDCGLVLLSTKIDQGFGAVRPVIEHDGLSVLDLTALRDDLTDDEFNAGRYDPHPSARVHRRIAERVASWMLARGGL